ncbi:MAG TPA: EAL domain-containing protein [Steroidobacteraceae bacterium]|jgi:EAL domain-containing protein (putative c-di-GMP-specific phosphodiesterase class I)|nr:EAL domain-containing protein [Steroidobacteraceae bacterium]
MDDGISTGATNGPLVDFDGVCQKVRAAAEPARVHAVSLHDEFGEVLWLTESSMGPDEHGAVRAGIEALSKTGSPPLFIGELGGSRCALMLRAVSRRRTMVGAIMVVMDARVIKDPRGILRTMTPKLHRALVEFADMRCDSEVDAIPLATPAAPRGAMKPVSRVSRAPLTSAAPAPPAAIGPAAAASPARSTPTLAAETGRTPAPIGAAAVVGRVGNPSRFANMHPRAVPPEIDRLHSMLRRSPIALHVQRLVPLAKGTHLKRYEVLMRSKADAAANAAPLDLLKAAVDHGLGSMIDRRVITELIGYLVKHPDIWKATPVQFSVNLTATALHDEHFIKFVGLCLTKSALPRSMIAFEVDAATAVKLAGKMAAVGASLHRLGCPLVLDDFSLRTECLALLRLPGVHYVKLAPEITSKMRTDKLAQAAITAVVQMARVLGMHTVAKHAESASEQEWFTALGVDLVQSNSMSPPEPIETLASRPPTP